MPGPLPSPTPGPRSWAVHAVRFPENPLIRPGLAGLESTNLNGPSLIRVPAWVAAPLGRYYLYFADHHGRVIQLAYADELRGPWRLHGGGVLRLEQTAAQRHLASPDVHVDQTRRELVMYFHGPCAGGPWGQVSYAATSGDGLHFVARREVLGPFYFRVFAHEGWYYAVAKDANEGGLLLRARDPLAPFDVGPKLVPRMRHAAVLVRGQTLWLFFSRMGDEPEEILVSRIDLRRDWREWEAAMSPPETVLTPQEGYEGAFLPLTRSAPGASRRPERALRDPAILVEQERVFLFYAVAGEQGLAGAELSFA